MDDVVIDFMNNKYIDIKIKTIIQNDTIFNHFLYSLNLKDLLVNNVNQIHFHLQCLARFILQIKYKSTK